MKNFDPQHSILIVYIDDYDQTFKEDWVPKNPKRMSKFKFQNCTGVLGGNSNPTVSDSKDNSSFPQFIDWI